MKLLLINTAFKYGSTGRICFDLANIAQDQGHIVKILYGRGGSLDSRAKKITSNFDMYFHALQTRVFDNHGIANDRATRRAVKWIEEFKPDVIHLHNLHGYYINYQILFEYIKAKQFPVVWTLHDCWAFTGHCAYYSMANCNKWETHCGNCILKKEYPSSYIFDRSEKNFKEKKICFTDVKRMQLVTPSKWLACEVKKSFLKNYKVDVIYNGIDLDVFKPIKSNFKVEKGLVGKKIILGVANVWDDRKGLNDFIELSHLLDEKWIIVLVGISKKQTEGLPANILTINRTDNIQELAGIYSSADVFVNPSREETMGMVTLEALACGTPAIVYNKTAVPEMVPDNCGYVVEDNPKEIYNKLALVNKIRKEECICWAHNFEKRKTYENYLHLYDKIRTLRRL